METDPWMRHMKRGEFEEAWKVSDRVLRSRAGTDCSDFPRHFQYVWDGAPLQGQRVLIRCYHGLGDTIHFIRYAPLVKAMAREVIVWAQAELIPLLRTMKGIDRLLPLHDGTPEVEYDTDVEVMELPHVFRTTLKSVPAEIPYFEVEPLELKKEGKAVGLAWKVGDWDEHRSIPFRLLRPLGEIPGVTFHILQRGSGLDEYAAGFGVLTGSDDILQTARVLAGLDLLISVDAMLVHLGGALGAPVWTLLPADANWRWMERREDTPWYPTMRLFRQEERNNWIPLLRRVKEELRGWAEGS